MEVFKAAGFDHCLPLACVYTQHKWLQAQKHVYKIHPQRIFEGKKTTKSNHFYRNI